MAQNVVSKIFLLKKQIFVTSVKTITVEDTHTASFRLCMLSFVLQPQ